MRQPTPTEPSPRALAFLFSGAGTHELPNPLGWVPKNEGKFPVLDQHCNIFH